MSVRIQIRGDLASAWAAVNPVLAEREVGIETDTRYIKIGNGAAAWNALPYALSPDLYQAKLVSGANIKTINGESLLGSGNIPISGGGGSGGTSKVTRSNILLGTLSGNQTGFTYYTVPNTCIRGIVSLFNVTVDAVGNFDIEVRGLGNSGGELMLAATDITSASYLMSSPWYYESEAGAPSLFIAIRNRSPSPRTFTLSSLRLEAFAT
jgi:hypothetical protein